MKSEALLYGFLIAVAALLLATSVFLFRQSASPRQPIPLPSPTALTDVIPAKLEVPFRLKIGQSAFIEPEGLIVKFLEVTEDSRCPSGVQCVWAGRVTILVQILRNAEELGEFELSLPALGQVVDRQNFDGYSLQFVQIAPTARDLARSTLDYTATLVVY